MTDLLTLSRVSAGYGEAVVINGIDLRLEQGKSLAVLGRNGTGKTTLINTIVGVTRHRGGTIALGGRDVTGLRPDQRASSGIGWVPQERNIFKSLTVEENLTAVARPGAWTVERVYGLFPRLKERRSNMGNQLSGGEQQMLAVARALVARPKVILFDEPSLGIAPMLVEAMFDAILEIRRREQVTVLVVEQNAEQALRVADAAHVMELGRIVASGDPARIGSDPEIARAYLGS